MIKTETMNEHYNQGKEANRLLENSLERLRTESILTRFLPPAPATILDVGGGAGVYAFSLARKGYKVHLVDPIPLHIEQANERNRMSNTPLESATLGDARSLQIKDGTADGVLFLGPLYHLTQEDDRLGSLREAWRVLKPGGIFIGAFISRFTSLIDGVRGGFLADSVFREIVKNDLETSQHRNPTSHPAYFTEAYFHHPASAKAEVERAGFKDCQLISIEGPIWMIESLTSQLQSPDLRPLILEFLEKIENEQSLIGASGHFSVVAQK